MTQRDTSTMGDTLVLEGKPTSIWLDTTQPTGFSGLQGDLAVDVAIVGGGIAGLTAATLLKAAGKTVAVLERGRILEGVTAFTTAKLTSQHSLIYDHLIRDFGEDKARAYAQANQAAIEHVATFVAQSGIDCDFARTEAYTFTESPDEVERFAAEVEAAIRLGLPAALTEQTPLPFPVAIAVRFDNQARFHPRKYLLALAATIPGDGSHIFEQTTVMDVLQTKALQVRTNRGVVTAGDVIVASHFPIYDNAFYFARMAPYRSYVVAVRLDGAAPAGVFISTGSGRHSIRSHPAGRADMLLVGGEGHKVGQGGDTVARYQRLEQWAREHFPVRSVEYRWSTQDNETFDRVPYIGRMSPLSDHVYVATGFAGWGMTNGTVSGMLLCDLILGRPNPWAEVYDPNRFNLESAPQFVKENLNVAAHYMADRIIDKSAENVPSGEGAIVETEAGKMAIVKNETGEVQQLSPVCTHMGCYVNWNPAEKSWDCPCHGSRFSADGQVIHGPAIKALKAK